MRTISLILRDLAFFCRNSFAPLHSSASSGEATLSEVNSEPILANYFTQVPDIIVTPFWLLLVAHCLGNGSEFWPRGTQLTAIISPLLPLLAAWFSPVCQTVTGWVLVGQNVTVWHTGTLAVTVRHILSMCIISRNALGTAGEEVSFWDCPEILRQLASVVYSGTSHNEPSQKRTTSL